MAYSKKFFSNREAATHASAQEIVPYLLNLVRPESVVDVGCGNGVWLEAFTDAGIRDYLGIDGHWVADELLRVPKEKFLRHDLATGMPRIDKVYDLAISIEVGEHLPHRMADEFIEFLCGLAPIVAFSAAVPLQGGTGHCNEQPQSYWMEKFGRYSFACVDCVRPRIWRNANTNVVHRQNLLVYVSEARDELLRKLAEFQVSAASLVDVIHPELYELRIRQARQRRNPLSRLFSFVEKSSPRKLHGR